MADGPLAELSPIAGCRLGVGLPLTALVKCMTGG
jgi:hypothetical protein